MPLVFGLRLFHSRNFANLILQTNNRLAKIQRLLLFCIHFIGSILSFQSSMKCILYHHFSWDKMFVQRTFFSQKYVNLLFANVNIFCGENIFVPALIITHCTGVQECQLRAFGSRLFVNQTWQLAAVMVASSQQLSWYPADILAGSCLSTMSCKSNVAAQRCLKDLAAGAHQE